MLATCEDVGCTWVDDGDITVVSGLTGAEVKMLDTIVITVLLLPCELD